MPTGPLGGKKLLRVGVGITIKLTVPVTEPLVVVTVIGPEVALAGTVAVIVVALNDPVEETPLNFTD